MRSKLCLLLALIVIVGCKSKPSMPPPIPLASKTQLSSVLNTSVATNIVVRWNYLMPIPSGYTFEVWATTNLQSPFKLDAETTTTQWVEPEAVMKFFMVRVRDSNGVESAWGTVTN